MQMRVVDLPMAITLLLLVGPAGAQDVGRPEDGFYSGQSNGQSNGRVDGRANRNEGVPPSSGDEAKQQQPVGRTGPTTAESMDAIVAHLIGVMIRLR
jgi:hypothetical protein